MAHRVVAIVALIMVAAVAGCGPSTSLADGPRKQICGEWIGRAATLLGSGPWYVDASTGHLSTISASAGASPTWVQVSRSCQHGAQVTISDPAVIGITEVVAASDGADVVVLVSPRSNGYAVLTATVRDAGTQTVAFMIHTPATPPPPSTS